MIDRRWLIFAAGAVALIAATAAGALPFCDLMFSCGCTWPWSGGMGDCNIFDAAAPDCPWCSHGAAVGYGLPGLMVAAGLIALGLPLYAGQSAVFAALISTAAWLATGLAPGLALAIYDGYPTFLGVPI